MAVKHQIDVAAGVINPDYQGEIKVVLVNNGQHNFQVTKGERIAQLILEHATIDDIIIVDTLNETTRGQDGFGSMGMTQEQADVFEITLGHTASKRLRPQEERYEDLRKIIPHEYHDYLNVFDEELSMSRCPEPREGYDFEINLKEGAKLPPPAKPYHLSQAEMKILDEWLDGMLETGMISKCSNKTPTAAPVFFIGKKDGTKRPVIDY